MYVSQISTYEMGNDDHKAISSIQQLMGGEEGGERQGIWHDLYNIQNIKMSIQLQNAIYHTIIHTWWARFKKGMSFCSVNQVSESYILN